jgi:EpsI family protein
MNAARRKALAVAAAAIGTAGLAHALRPTHYLSDRLGKPVLDSLFPASFGAWRIDPNVPVVLPSPETQALLDTIYNQTLGRTYVDDRERRVMLSVAYGGDQSDATKAHVPEVCYPAQGFRISRNERGELDLGGRKVPVRLLMSQLGSRFEPITYWLVIGDRVTVSRTEQKLVQFRLGLRGYIPDGMLVRVSSFDEDMARGHALQAEFLRDMALAVPVAARDRVFGSGAA